MRILLAYRAIDGIAGGVERMLTRLLNEMVARGHEMHLFTIDHADAVSYYPMDDRVHWHRLDMGDYREKAGWKLRFARARAARRLIKDIQPDFAIAFQDGTFFNMVGYRAFTGIPLVLAERISPQHYDFLKRGKVQQKLLHILARFAAKITIQCESYRAMYPAHLRNKIVTIPNPVFPAKRHATPDVAREGRYSILCVGRVGYQKNQALLISAFAEIADDYPDWDLVLAGEKDAGFVSPVDPHAQIVFKDAVKDVAALYAASHIFCLPSLFEGFPNALGEALSHGLPSVGFADCGGVRDLIVDGENGLLIDERQDKAALQAALKTLMDAPERRREMGAAAIESVRAYAPENIFDAWEKLFKVVVKT